MNKAKQVLLCCKLRPSDVCLSFWHTGSPNDGSSKDALTLKGYESDSVQKKTASGVLYLGLFPGCSVQ